MSVRAGNTAAQEPLTGLECQLLRIAAQSVGDCLRELIKPECNLTPERIERALRVLELVTPPNRPPRVGFIEAFTLLSVGEQEMLLDELMFRRQQRREKALSDAGFAPSSDSRR